MFFSLPRKYFLFIYLSVSIKFKSIISYILPKLSLLIPFYWLPLENIWETVDKPFADIFIIIFLSFFCEFYSLCPALLSSAIKGQNNFYLLSARTQELELDIPGGRDFSLHEVSQSLILVKTMGEKGHEKQNHWRE